MTEATFKTIIHINCFFSSTCTDGGDPLGSGPRLTAWLTVLLLCLIPSLGLSGSGGFKFRI